jgi:glycosyltransferase involved in cell wall biosynthesis
MSSVGIGNRRRRHGSTDRTREVAEKFSYEVNSAMRNPQSAFVASGVRWVTLAQKGRGWALKHVWLNTDADVLVYMDADLSTELDALPALIGESN